MILPEYCDLDFLMTDRHGLLRIIEDFFIQFLTIAETSILNVFNQAKQQTIPPISASDSARFQLYIYFRSFRPDFLSVFHEGYSPPPTQELHIDCKFPRQAATKRTLRSILSANCINTIELTAVQFIVDGSMHNIENKNLSTELSKLPPNHFVDDAGVEY